MSYREQKENNSLRWKSNFYIKNNNFNAKNNLITVIADTWGVIAETWGVNNDCEAVSF